MSSFTVFVKFTMCIIGGNVCLDEKIQWQSEHALTPQACMLNSIPRIAEFVEKSSKYKSGWRVERFSCVTKQEIEA